MTDIFGLGGVAQAVGTVAAAQTQADTASKALGEQKSEFNTGQANEEPWLQTGGAALGQLQTLYGMNGPSATSINPAQGGMEANNGHDTGSNVKAPGFTNAAGGGSTVNPNASFYLSPDYNFQLTQGLKGVTASGAAGSGTDNGATRKAEIGYAGNLASGQYQDYKNGLLSLAGLGQTASSSANAAGQTNANAQSGIITAAGNNQASAYAALGKQIGTGITQYQAANPPVPAGTTSGNYNPTGDQGETVGF